ncbi:MAG: beta-N-acetylglucosaminidase domain-containing protein [Collinsella sp.]
MPTGPSRYPGLKDTLIFCPVNYMGHGENWYRTLGENVQVINTGGQVWGKIDNAFATTFKNNSGVAPFMWINWPCSDNDKDALHMGGHNNFLGSDLKPGQVKGVVINPMQQSEPSKQGIFMTADFTWNLWGSTEHADQVWEKSFSYIDHNSGKETEGSNALRELSGHMKRMYGGGATWENDESADIKQELADFRAKLSSDTRDRSRCRQGVQGLPGPAAHRQDLSRERRDQGDGGADEALARHLG